MWGSETQQPYAASNQDSSTDGRDERAIIERTTHAIRHKRSPNGVNCCAFADLQHLGGGVLAFMERKWKERREKRKGKKRDK
jgi:hypothetical protein